jgi:hypothetical protein
MSETFSMGIDSRGDSVAVHDATGVFARRSSTGTITFGLQFRDQGFAARGTIRLRHELEGKGERAESAQTGARFVQESK